MVFIFIIGLKMSAASSSTPSLPHEKDHQYHNQVTDLLAGIDVNTPKSSTTFDGFLLY
jgi:hypothetical protein